MQIRICSADAQFVKNCQHVVKVWSESLCMNTQVRLVKTEEELLTDEKMHMVFLDADTFPISESLQREAENLADALIVCTRNSQQAIQSYRMRPTAFLPKPFTAQMLMQITGRCIQLWQNMLQELTVTENRMPEKIPLCEIMWIEAMGHRSLIHGIRRELLVSESMNALLEALPPNLFVRCQRSYLVNLYHVQATDGNVLEMDDGKALPLSRSLRQAMLAAMEHFQQNLVLAGTEPDGSYQKVRTGR